MSTIKKLTLADAMRIRVEYRLKQTTVEELASQYRVPRFVIQRILDRKSHSVSAITSHLWLKRLGRERKEN